MVFSGAWARAPRWANPIGGHAGGGGMPDHRRRREPMPCSRTADVVASTPCGHRPHHPGRPRRAVGLYLVVLYNGLVSLRNRIENAWAQIDVQLKRRYDLIPNLVETVKGYAAHERETLEAVIQARNMAMAAAGPAASRPRPRT